MLNYPILVPALVIGMKASEKLYVLLEDKVEDAGGIILIAIGVKTLLEHLS